MKIKSILIDTDEGHFFIGTSVVKAKTFTGIDIYRSKIEIAFSI